MCSCSCRSVRLLAPAWLEGVPWILSLGARWLLQSALESGACGGTTLTELTSRSLRTTWRASEGSKWSWCWHTKASSRHPGPPAPTRRPRFGIPSSCIQMCRRDWQRRAEDGTSPQASPRRYECATPPAMTRAPRSRHAAESGVPACIQWTCRRPNPDGSSARRTWRRPQGVGENWPAYYCAAAASRQSP